MDNNLKFEITKRYRNILIDMQTKDIKALMNGFIRRNSCKPFGLSICVHCLENIEIFTKNQQHNIDKLINQIIYG